LRPRKGILTRGKHLQQVAVLGSFLVILGVFIILNPRVFLNYGIYRTLFRTIPIWLNLALGVALVIITGEIDLSFGSIAALSGMIFTSILLATENHIVSLIVCLIVGTAAGCLNGVLITKIRIPSIILTLGTMFFWRGFVYLIIGGSPMTAMAFYGKGLYPILVGNIGGVPSQMLWTVGFAVIVWVLLNRHRFGGYIYYVGTDVQTAKLMGIKVDNVKIAVFGISGLMAAFSSMISIFLNLAFWPTLGEGYLLPVLAIVFIGGTPPTGGTGSIFGVCIAALLLGILDSGLIAAGLVGHMVKLFHGAFLIFAVSLYSVLARRKFNNG
jgi:simple sugar transport system permease protein